MQVSHAKLARESSCYQKRVIASQKHSTRISSVILTFAHTSAEEPEVTRPGDVTASR